jgi:hypothetical protein
VAETTIPPETPRIFTEEDYALQAELDRIKLEHDDWSLDPLAIH